MATPKYDILYDIIIIGGGIAGLYKAHQHLKKDPNKKILLLEAANRLGGRIYTYQIGRASCRERV